METITLNFLLSFVSLHTLKKKKSLPPQAAIELQVGSEQLHLETSGFMMMFTLNRQLSARQVHINTAMDGRPNLLKTRLLKMSSELLLPDSDSFL